MSMNTRLIDLIHRAGNPGILVVGDLILDSYIQGGADRISPEAPIQVLDVHEERYALGGAANVAANLQKLGASVELCGVVGDGPNGNRLREMLADSGIGFDGVLTDPSRPTTNKMRVVAHNQQLIRIDREVSNALTPEMESRLFDVLKPRLETADMIVLSDYAKGVLSPGMIRRIVEHSAADILVDPKGNAYHQYHGCRLITPNRREAETYTGISLDGQDNLKKAAAILFERIGVREVVITMGAEGIYYATDRENDHWIPAHSRSVYDVTGAGDTVISLIAFCLATGFSLDDAVRIANAGAGIVVGKPGVAAPNRAELAEFFSSGTTRYIDKIVTRAQAKDIADRLRQKGERLVFTNGCFDLVHGGHVRYLRTAKSLGDALMVGVNDDDSVRTLKGPKRPILGLEERMEILASLQVVDFVVGFSEDTPLELIRSITPAVLIKGEDWREKGVVGREWVEGHGGEVQLVPLREGCSTTGVIERVLERFGKEAP